MERMLMGVGDCWSCDVCVPADVDHVHSEILNTKGNIFINHKNAQSIKIIY